jgi:hypothetical protein
MASVVPDVTGEIEDLDGFDAGEDVGSGAAGIKPWDPKKIRITTQSFTLREIVEQIEEGDVDLAPDFQREFVWRDRQRTRLVESVLLGIPLPAFYFNQNESASRGLTLNTCPTSTVSPTRNSTQPWSAAFAALRSLSMSSSRRLRTRSNMTSSTG